MYYLFMTLGGANVWTNFSYGNFSDSPCGWLLNSEARLIIFFEKYKKSKKKNIKILTYLFYANQFGEPHTLKSSSTLLVDDAWDKWHQLKLDGWKELSKNFNINYV